MHGGHGVSQPRVALVDRMSIWSMLALAVVAPGAEVLSFEDPSAAARSIRRARRLGLLRRDVRAVATNIGDLRDENGASPLIGLLRDARDLSRRIRDGWLVRDDRRRTRARARPLCAPRPGSAARSITRSSVSGSATSCAPSTPSASSRVHVPRLGTRDTPA